MAKIINQLTLITIRDGLDGEDSPAVGIYPGICDSLGSEIVKNVVLEKTIEAENGIQIAVKFKYANTSPTAQIQLVLEDGTHIGNPYVVYAGDQALTYPSMYNWFDNQMMNFIFFDNKWYIASISSANAIDFKNGSLSIFNSQYGKDAQSNTGLKMELGNTSLDFKIANDKLAHYGVDGVKLYEVTEDEKKQGKPYSQFGPTTILGYEDELEPHLTAQNTYLAMNDSLGEYFRVSRKGLMYKARIEDGVDGDGNQTYINQWIGISPDGGIGIIENNDMDDWSDSNFTPTIKDGEDAISVQITSSNGNIFRDGNIITQLICRVYSGLKDITDTIHKFTWQKINSDGTLDDSWLVVSESNTITVTSSDVSSRASFTCSVELDS